jgi:hypothetical protein
MVFDFDPCRAMSLLVHTDAQTHRSATHIAGSSMYLGKKLTLGNYGFRSFWGEEASTELRDSCLLGSYSTV